MRPAAQSLHVMALDVFILILWTAIDPSKPHTTAYDKFFELQGSTINTFEIHDTVCEYGVAGIISFDLQYSYRRVQASTRDWSEQSEAEDVGASLKSIHKDAHKIFRILVRSLARAEDGDVMDGIGSGMTLMEPIGWLFDQFCELFGVGEPYRRLFELRVLLATLKPTAGCLGQVSVALNEMRTLEKREIVEWTKDERALESSIVLHLQESLSRCFIMYKTAFPHAAVQNGALSLAVHVFSLVMDDSDEDMRTLIIQHADRMVDIILQGSDLDGSIVKPRILSCLLFELRRDLRDTMDLYRSSFPDGVKIIETHSAQYAGPESRVRNAIVNCVSNMSSQQMESDEAMDEVMAEAYARLTLCRCDL